MEGPKLQWYGKLEKDHDFEATSELFAGTKTGRDEITAILRLWNNRWGMEDVEDLRDFYFNIFFETTEDNALLRYCKIYLDDSKEPLSMYVDDMFATVSIPEDIIIRGRKNNGISMDNKENYITLKVTISTPATVKLRENQLKSLYFEIMEKSN